MCVFFCFWFVWGFFVTETCQLLFLGVSLVADFHLYTHDTDFSLNDCYDLLSSLFI